MTRSRKFRFWLDNPSGALTDYTADVRRASLRRLLDTLEDAGSEDADLPLLPGLRRAELPLEGWYDDGSTRLFTALWSAQESAASKTWQLWLGGSHYYFGECYVADLQTSGEGGSLRVFSALLRVDGAANKTSVQQS
jgi:hypothetical protein